MCTRALVKALQNFNCVCACVGPSRYRAAQTRSAMRTCVGLPGGTSYGNAVGRWCHIVETSGACCLLPFAVVSCARARAVFIRPCECATQGGAGCCSVWAHPAQRGGVFHGTPFRRPVRLRAVSAVRASGGPAGSCEGACARDKCGALCCAERQGHPCSPAGGPLPGNLIASKSLEDAPGCGLSPPRLHWGAGRVHLA